MHPLRLTLRALMLVGPATLTTMAQAGPDDVLFVVVCGGSTASCYYDAATRPIDWLVDEGADLDFVLLNEQASTQTSPPSIPMPSDLTAYGQVWVIDFSSGADNAPIQTAGFDAIGTWFEGLADSRRNVIADARLLAGVWGAGAANNQQAQFGNPDGAYYDEQLVRNYYELMRDQGGGLMLGTDHATAFTRGINRINAQIGLEPFEGFFFSPPYVCVTVDDSPLLANDAPRTVQIDNPWNTLPVGTRYLRDDSSTSDAPMGLQPNGLQMHTAAWHLGFIGTRAAITSTFDAEGFGAEVCKGAPGLTTGASANLRAFGSTRISDDKLSLRVTGLPPAGTVAFLFNSRGTNLVSVANPMVGGVASAGTICIGSVDGFGRHLGADVFAGSGGTFEISVNVDAVPFLGAGSTPPFLQAIQVGETWNWQCWYRDGNQQAGQSNMSDAISIQFVN